MSCHGLIRSNIRILAIAKAESIAIGCCCAQILWMKQILEDFGLNLKKHPYILTTRVTKNPAQDSRMKHIDRHHFIRDHIQKRDITTDFVRTLD